LPYLGQIDLGQHGLSGLVCFLEQAQLFVPAERKGMVFRGLVQQAGEREIHLPAVLVEQVQPLAVLANNHGADEPALLHVFNDCALQTHMVFPCDEKSEPKPLSDNNWGKLGAQVG
jgi:hypothetical protein